MEKRSFTLIELIFVIVIIGLLAAVAVPKFLTTKKNAETANLPSVGHQVVTKATEQYTIVQEENLSKIIDEDKDLKRYYNEIKDNPLFDTDKNYEEFNISWHSTGEVCLKVYRDTTVYKINKNDEGITYDFIVKELNTSCNAD